MAVPKKRTSRHRRDLRRHSSAYRMTAAHTVKCNGCGAPSLSHRVCAECGFYGGKQVAEAKSLDA
jgi:large subunit ribosomal protein L32